MVSILYLRDLEFLIIYENTVVLNSGNIINRAIPVYGTVYIEVYTY